MKLRNKSAKKDQFRQGKNIERTVGNGWYKRISLDNKDPLKFANSNELEKIQNRNRKNK